MLRLGHARAENAARFVRWRCALAFVMCEVEGHVRGVGALTWANGKFYQKNAGIGQHGL